MKYLIILSVFMMTGEVQAKAFKIPKTMEIIIASAPTKTLRAKMTKFDLISVDPKGQNECDWAHIQHNHQFSNTDIILTIDDGGAVTNYHHVTPWGHLYSLDEQGVVYFSYFYSDVLYEDARSCFAGTQNGVGIPKGMRLTFSKDGSSRPDISLGWNINGKVFVYEIKANGAGMIKRVGSGTVTSWH